MPFSELIRDDIGTVAQIYAKADLPMTGSVRASLQQFVQSHRDDYGRVRYDLAGQFGVSAATLRKRFEFYFDAFPFLREGSRNSDL